jgi:FixJ family two-component response regulator
LSSLSSEQAIRPQLLLVEDDDGLRRALQLFLYSRGYDVRAFSSAAHALADGRVEGAHTLVADYRLPDTDGVALLQSLRARGWAGRAILVTGFPSPGLASAARAAGYAAILEKPVPHHRLVAAIDGTASMGAA